MGRQDMPGRRNRGRNELFMAWITSPSRAFPPLPPPARQDPSPDSLALTISDAHCAIYCMMRRWLVEDVEAAAATSGRSWCPPLDAVGAGSA
jgi:hypothetical protein